MTQKEKLYREFVIAKNKLNALKGETLIGGDNIEEYFNSYDFSNRASHHTKEEIKNMIDYAERCYESEVEKLRVENYFNTEEGKAEKERLTKEYDALLKERTEIFKRANSELDTFIKDFLGDEWGVNYGRYSVEIGIVKDVNDNFKNFVFGHTFTVSYGDIFGESFKMNYGCLGSFDLLNDKNLRPSYLMGMAKFANDKDRLAKLHLYLKSIDEDIDSVEGRIDKVSDKLNHPIK